MSGLFWFQTAKAMLANAEDQSGVNVFSLYNGPFAMVKDALSADGATDGPRQDIELVSSRMYKVNVGSDEYVAIILCRISDAGAPEWTVYCGDKQLQGTHRDDGKTLANQLRKVGKVSNSVCNALEAGGWVAKVPLMANCGSLRMLKRGLAATPPKVILCSHAKVALKNVLANEVEEMAVELQGWLSGAVSTVKAPAVPLSAEVAAIHDAAFIQHVLLAGERGSGKTFQARAVADQYDAVYLEMQMHPSMEAWEFRAHDRAWNGKVYTVLGKLAEAVYWIKQGKKVVLCMDEFLNMNPLYTTAINTPLSLTENDTYLIETGRIIDMGDGIGTLETVEVPCDMFWVVATSNIGPRYNLDKITPSVRARFQIILMNTNPESTKKILESILGKYGMPPELAEMFGKFLKSVNQAVLESTLEEEATTRLACNVVRAVYLKAKRDKKVYTTVRQWMPEIKKQLTLEIAQVVNFEMGPLDSDQKLQFMALLDACFKMPK